MYYTIYQITNKLNGKIYIGSHKTKNLNDEYMGSGKYLNHAINKQGVENFEKEILHVFETADEMYAKEAEIVSNDFLSESNTYNLKRGGFGGWDHVNSVPRSKQHIEKCVSVLDEHRHKGWKTGSENNNSANLKKRHALGLVRYDTFKGKQHSAATKRKIGAANKTQCGSKNSQFGTMWITNEESNQKIKRGATIPVGWRPGRIIHK